MKSKKFPMLLGTPMGLVIVLGALIAVVEFLIMLVAHDIFVPAIFSEGAWDYIDTALLILIVAPALYFLVFRKLQEDITVQKRAQRALQENAQRTQAILDNAVDGIITIDGSGIIDSFNRAAERIFGYAANEVVGQNVRILMPEPSSSMHDGYIETYLTTGVARIIGVGREVVGRRKDGSTFPLDLAISELRHDDKPMFIGMTRDITERKRAEAAREKYHTILSTATDGFWIVDKDGRLLEVNDAYCKMSGYSRDTLLHMRIPDLEAKESTEGTRQHIEQIIAKGSDQFESRHRRKDGVIIDVEISVQFMPSVDEIFVVFVKDITTRKQNEARMHQAREEAEASSRAKSVFLSVMSHELRTPLNAILGFGQLLESDPGFSTPDQQQSIRYILSAGHQLLGLVNDLLDLARIDVGKLALDLKPVPIADLVSSCVEQVTSALAQQRNITIENMIADTSLVVQGDDLRIRQVLINLLSNAVKYNRNNGRVTVSSCIGEKAGRLRIQVQDNGNGIASDKLPLLFSPFERIDQKHGTISGVGIGLHIAKQLVEAMHGTIGVESIQGQGSTFWFDLPIAEKADESTVAPGKTRRRTAHGDSRFVVLYIEDNALNVQLVEMALQKQPGIELLTAGSAEEGLAIAEKHPPDLILMDMHLPGIDGITATTTLKGIEATKHVPVVALSADAMKADIDRALGSGCSAYLTKPIELQALYEVIDGIRLAEK